MIVNLWIALSQQALDEFKDKRSLGDSYTGPMDDTTFNILSKMADLDTVQKMFLTPTIGGKVYHLFSVYVEGTVKAQNAIDHLTQEWPNHFIVLGAWWFDSRQVGTSWTYDASGNITGVTGTPTYTIHTDTWRLIPNALSNDDLEDINVLQGQAPRRFN